MMIAACIILVIIIFLLICMVVSLNHRVYMLEAVVDNMGMPLNALLKVYGMIANIHDQDWSDSETVEPGDVLRLDGKEHKHVR